MARAVRIVVSGIVQGVGYRYWTAQVAARLGIRGWVRNLHDGRVQIHAEGQRIDELVKRCHEGPRFADVRGVECEDTATTDMSSFEVLPSADLTSST